MNVRLIFKRTWTDSDNRRLSSEYGSEIVDIPESASIFKKKGGQTAEGWDVIGGEWLPEKQPDAKKV